MKVMITLHCNFLELEVRHFKNQLMIFKQEDSLTILCFGIKGMYLLFIECPGMINMKTLTI